MWVRASTPGDSTRKQHAKLHCSSVYHGLKEVGWWLGLMFIGLIALGMYSDSSSMTKAIRHVQRELDDFDHTNVFPTLAHVANFTTAMVDAASRANATGNTELFLLEARKVLQTVDAMLQQHHLVLDVP